MQGKRACLDRHTPEEERGKACRDLNLGINQKIIRKNLIGRHMHTVNPLNRLRKTVKEKRRTPSSEVQVTQQLRGFRPTNNGKTRSGGTL